MKAYVCSKCKKVFLTNIVTVTKDSAKNKRGRIAWGRDCVCEECQKASVKDGKVDAVKGGAE